MRQASTRYSLLNRFLPGYLGCLLALLSWGYPAAYAAGRAHGTGMAPLASPTAAVVYTWSATGTSASWSAPGSWTPARTTPDPSDILQFTSSSAASTVLIDFGASQTIGSLFISTGSAVTFDTDGTDGNTGFGRTLTVTNGSTGADLTLSSSSTLTVYTSSTYLANTGLTMALGSGAAATINGHLVFDSAVQTTNSSGISQQLLGNGPNSVEFTSTSVFTTQANSKGNPFGSANSLANSVVFRNGSRFEFAGGSNPFALMQPSSIVTFEPTSTFLFAPPVSTQPSLAGRTYGNFEYNLPTRTANVSGTGTVTVTGDLIVTAGTASINLTGGAILKGNLLMNGGTLNFTPNSAATVQFVGTVTQTISGSASTGPTFGPNATVQLNNAAGLTLTQSISIPGTLQLTNGLLTVTSGKQLTLAAGATINGGSASSFVNGPLRRVVGATNTATAMSFPIGKGADYRPLTLNVASQTSNTIYQVEQFNQDGGTNLAAPLQRVSRLRFYTVTPYDAAAPATVTQPTGFSGTLTVSFGTSDRVTSSAATSFVVAKRADSSQPWVTTGTSTGNTTTGTVSGPLGTFASGTLTSGSFSGFSDFALASTDADPTVNPLPVQLTRFVAVRSAKGGVALAWATASELRSAGFEVERSLDGQTFAWVATVAAAGSSAQAREYAAQDAGASLDQLYYRLHLLDVDGTTAYSPVATVAAGAASELELLPNPAHDQLGLLTERPAAYCVRNTLGQEVLTGTTQAGILTSLDVSSLAAGVYFLELPGNMGRVVRRFVKK